MVVATDHVAAQLLCLFEVIASPDITRSQLKSIFEYPGVLASLSARIQIAQLFRLFPKPTIDAMHALRKLRNAVAHSPNAFTLSEHTALVHRIYDLGPGVLPAIQRQAFEALMTSVFARVGQIENPVNPGRKFTERDVIDHLTNNRESAKFLDAQRPRFELAMGVGLICHLIIDRREELRPALGKGILRLHGSPPRSRVRGRRSRSNPKQASGRQPQD